MYLPSFDRGRSLTPWEHPALAGGVHFIIQGTWSWHSWWGQTPRGHLLANIFSTVSKLNSEGFTGLFQPSREPCDLALCCPEWHPGGWKRWLGELGSLSINWQTNVTSAAQIAGLLPSQFFYRTDSEHSLPHRGLTARLARQTEAQSGPGRGGASSSSIWLPPDRHNHTGVSYPDKILFRVVKIADTENSLWRLMFPTLGNWGEFWNVGSLTSQSLLSTFQLCLSTSNHDH